MQSSSQVMSLAPTPIQANICRNSTLPLDTIFKYVKAIVKFNGDNFVPWKRDMLNVLDEAGLRFVVEVSIEAKVVVQGQSASSAAQSATAQPETGRVAIVEDATALQEKDRLTRRLMQMAIVPDLQDAVREAKSAKEAWDYLNVLDNWYSSGGWMKECLS